MPESPESLLGGRHVQYFIDETPSEARVLQSIQADATIKEQQSHPTGSPAAEGLVYPLESSSKIQRGQNGSQTDVFPPKYQSEDDAPISSHKLELVAAETSPRNVLLQFRENKDDGTSEDYWAQVCLCIHRVQHILNT